MTPTRPSDPPCVFLGCVSTNRHFHGPFDQRDSMTVQEIARNLVDEFPAIPSDIRSLVRSEIAGALGHERDAAGLTADALAAVLPAALNFEFFAYPVGHTKWAEIADRIVALLSESAPPVAPLGEE